MMLARGLKGYDLIFWCKPGALCHAEVLLAMACRPLTGPLSVTKMASAVNSAATAAASFFVECLVVFFNERDKSLP